MAFTRTWDAAYEALPTDANYGYEIDDYIRQTRVDVSERMAIDHVWKTGATDGMHKLSGFQGSQYAPDLGSTDTYAITLSPVPSAYFNGMVVVFKANTGNTGAATLNVNGLGAKAIKKKLDEALSTGDIIAGQIVVVVYDGTNFQMISETASKRVSLKTGETWDSSTTGDLAITGAGFKPTGIFVLCGSASPAAATKDFASIGVSSAASNDICLYNGTLSDETRVWRFSGSVVRIDKSYGVYSSAILKSFDADGCTLTFSKGGAMTGSLLVEVLFFR